MEDDFRPPPWMRNPHVQSLLVSLPLRRPLVERRAASLIRASEEHLLDCGDGVRLQCFHTSPERLGRTPAGRTAVLLHGWEGSANSLYILSLARKLLELGFDVVRLNLRDHGETHHLNRELFHSCRLAEVVGAVRCIQAQFPRNALHLAGFSLGGNFMLRVAARAADAALDITNVIAVSPVLDPMETLHAIESGLGAYHRYFVRKWASSLLRKQAAWPADYDFRNLLRLASLRQMTAEMVARFTSFASLDEYLNGYSITGERLARLEVPATVITASDDPIIPVGAVQRLASPRTLNVTVTQHGGHCGFFDQLAGPRWLERKIVDEMLHTGR